MLQSPDVVQLTLGSHQLEGKAVPLKKPLALLDFSGGGSETDGMGQRCEVRRWQSLQWCRFCWQFAN